MLRGAPRKRESQPVTVMNSNRAGVVLPTVRVAVRGVPETRGDDLLCLILAVRDDGELVFLTWNCDAYSAAELVECLGKTLARLSARPSDE